MNEPEEIEAEYEEVADGEEIEDVTDELIGDDGPIPFADGDDDYNYEEPQEDEE